VWYYTSTPNTSSWHGAKLSTGTTSPFTRRMMQSKNPMVSKISIKTCCRYPAEQSLEWQEAFSYNPEEETDHLLA
jgi:hypothetical protein